MRRAFLICLVAAVLAAPLAISAQLPVKYVLSDQVIVADPTPASQFEDGPALAALFQSKFEAVFPGQIKHLSHDGPDGMIGPDERVILILPTLTAVRLGHEVKAGTIHTFQAMVVGDMSAIDPWTEANLMSGTRMVSAVVEIGQSELGTSDALLRQAFAEAYSRWLDAVIGQLKERLSPFVLDGPTVAPPAGVKSFRGGIWPFGSIRGVKRGATLSGNGRFVLVSAVFPKFSIIQDVASPDHTIPAGEDYKLTLVSKPVERPEPTVDLSWVGVPPGLPQGLQGTSLSEDAFLGLFDNYLSKGGGLQILPVPLRDPKVKEQVLKWIRQINAFSLRAEMNLASFDREVIARQALEAPDRRVEIGVMECYRGSRTQPDGSVQHYYRLTLGATVRMRVGSEDSPCYPLDIVVKQREEIARVEETGVREIDEDDVWFTVCRNAVIRLAKKVRDAMAALPSGARDTREALVQYGGTVDWKGVPPGPFVPLTWLRPAGEAKMPDGSSLGPVYVVLQASQGYLNPSVLWQEKLRPGDVLRYEAADTGKPIVAIHLEVSDPVPTWFPEVPWMERFAAKFLGAAGDALLVPEEGGAIPPGAEKVVNLGVSNLSALPQGGQFAFTGQWRCQVVPPMPGGGVPPVLKFGIQSDASVSVPTDALQPADMSGWGLQYSLDALRKLSEAGASKGLKKSFSSLGH